jgi:hypothetical protein
MIEWEADSMFYMDRPEEEEGQVPTAVANTVVLTPRKVRRQIGDKHQVMVDINMDSMNFVEVPMPKKKKGGKGKKVWKENF